MFGRYFAAANVRARIASVLFGVAFSAALITTLITYTVLVPGALLRTPQPSQAGAVAVLFSPQGHIMHLANLVTESGGHLKNRFAGTEGTTERI